MEKQVKFSTLSRITELRSANNELSASTQTISITEKKRNNNLIPLMSYEARILKSILEGCMDAEIADKLSVSERTVKEIEIDLMKKLNVENMSSVITYALESRLVPICDLFQSIEDKLN